MPTALETSKRKFQSLLDNLSTGSPANPASTWEYGQDPETPSPKRSRVSPRTARSDATVSSSRTNLRTAAKPPTLSGDAPRKREPPNYTPWSHETFLERLRTFSDLRCWTPKPDSINEVQWAKRGWICEGVNKVACRGGCEQRVVISLRPPRKDEQGQEIEGSEDYSVEIDEELVVRYVELIVTGHNEPCLWRGAGCKNDIYRLPIARPTIWRPGIRSRYDSFAKITQLPDLDIMDYPVNLEQLSRSLTPKSFETSVNPDRVVIQEGDLHKKEPSRLSAPSFSNSQEIRQEALVFSLLGWHGSDSDEIPIAHCEACFRRLGLWLYTSHLSDLGLKLDLLENHRPYCPWVNAVSQSMSGSFAGLAGWEILQKVIQNSVSSVSESHREKPLPDLPSEQAQGDSEGDGVQKAARMTGLDRSKAEETADKIRFARLKELTKAMSFKRFKKIRTEITKTA